MLSAYHKRNSYIYSLYIQLHDEKHSTFYLSLFILALKLP